jgi:hypothetical protein
LTSLKKIYGHAGIEPDWNLSDWGEKSIQARAKLYEKLLMKILTLRVPLPNEEE